MNFVPKRIVLETIVVKRKLLIEFSTLYNIS
jgi:hypothetical protein